MGGHPNDLVQRTSHRASSRPASLMPNPRVKPIQGMNAVSSLTLDETPVRAPPPAPGGLSAARSKATNHEPPRTPTPAAWLLHSVPASHPLRRLRPFGCPGLDDSPGQAPLTPPSPQKLALRGEWRGEGGTLRPAQRAYAAPLPHFRGQRQCQSASRCKSRRLALRARTTAAPWRNGGSLCRCSLQSAGQHSSPDGYLADSAASATPPQQHPRTQCAPSENPVRGNGAYIVPKTLRDRRLRRFGCGAPWKMMLRVSFSICRSRWRSFR